MANDGANHKVRPGSVRILIIDDHEKFRAFVSCLLAENHELHVIGEASDGLEAVRKAGELEPDLVLLDIGLPSLNGIEVAQKIRQFAPACRILFLSQESSPEIIQEALNVGAAGYVFKALAGKDLLAAVAAVIRGAEFISQKLPA